MIVPSMNSQELYNEIFSDYKIVERKAYYLGLSLRRAAVKSKHKHVREILNYKSKQHNNWIIIVDRAVASFINYSTVYYRDKHGLNGVSVSSNDLTLTHYTSHFIERYNERFMKAPNLSKLDLLKQFVTKNPVEAIADITDDETMECEIFGRFRDGVGLGFKEVFSEAGNEIIHFKTFISNEMILDGQRGGFNSLGEFYNEACVKLEKINKRRA